MNDRSFTQWPVPMQCSCCEPALTLVPAAAPGNGEPQWLCPASAEPYAVREGALVAIGPAGQPWDATTTAGVVPVHVIQVDLSREGYA